MARWDSERSLQINGIRICSRRTCTPRPTCLCSRRSSSCTLSDRTQRVGPPLGATDRDHSYTSRWGCGIDTRHSSNIERSAAVRPHHLLQLRPIHRRLRHHPIRPPLRCHRPHRSRQRQRFRRSLRIHLRPRSLPRRRRLRCHQLRRSRHRRRFHRCRPLLRRHQSHPLRCSRRCQPPRHRHQPRRPLRGCRSGRRLRRRRWPTSRTRQWPSLRKWQRAREAFGRAR